MENNNYHSNQATTQDTAANQQTLRQMD